MADTAADKGKEGKGWTNEDRLDIVLAALYDANQFNGIKWEAVANCLASKYPDKTPEAFRGQFKKLKATFCATFDVEAMAAAAGGKTPKTPRKRGAAAAAAASGDANETGEANGTPSAKKPCSNKKAAAAAAAKQAEEENAAIEEEGEV